MCDYELNETVYLACVARDGSPDTLRCSFCRVANPAKTPNPVRRSRRFVLANDKGTEVTVPEKYVFKCREDALLQAEKMKF